MALILWSCGWPVDPEATFEEAQGHQLRIGVVADPPWTLVETEDVVGGVEVSLAEELAAAMDADPVFRTGTTERMADALSRFELHLLIGGLTAGSAWGGEVALTPPYFTEEFVVASSKAAAPLEDLQDRRVLYPAEQPRLASWIEDHGGVPMESGGLYGPRSDAVTNLEEGALVALPVWRADQLGLVPVGITLAREDHVMAVPPGENRMLMELTQFLSNEATDPVSLLDRVTK